MLNWKWTKLEGGEINYTSLETIIVGDAGDVVASMSLAGISLREVYAQVVVVFLWWQTGYFPQEATGLKCLKNSTCL